MSARICIDMQADKQMDNRTSAMTAIVRSFLIKVSSAKDRVGVDRTLSMICPVHASVQAEAGKPQFSPWFLKFIAMFPNQTMSMVVNPSRSHVNRPRHGQTFGQRRLLGPNLEVKAGSVGGIRSNEIHL